MTQVNAKCSFKIMIQFHKVKKISELVGSFVSDHIWRKTKTEFHEKNINSQTWWW